MTLLHMRIDPQEVHCLAQNIYYEARGESLEGQIAVAEVTRNRVTKLPQDVFLPYCAVVYEPHQFSWTNAATPAVDDPVAFETSARIAAMVISGTVKFDTTSDHYLNKKKVKKKRKGKLPLWTKEYAQTQRIGDHWFYASR